MAAIGAAWLCVGCASTSASYEGQRTFTSAEAAVEGMAEAMRRDDVATLEAIFGDNAGEAISSGDATADRALREVFLVAFEKEWTLDAVTRSSRELVVGHERWPFPIPIVKDSRGWWFDTAAGREEVLARRIGRNELATIDAMRTYVFAQREYASEARDGGAPGAFAQQIVSDPGRRNGLYWPTEPDEAPSPLGDFASRASGEGYGDGAGVYYGYAYRVLTSQGPDAPGGAMDYIVNGAMTKGFALIAHPVEYGNSGVMTFIINQDGVAYESDLGPDTAGAAGAIDSYNPGAGWAVVE
ncbi:MAG: DUF2950 domain-containing protein [Phycisphaerales bacterium]